jgi:hypothetical protein
MDKNTQLIIQGITRFLSVSILIIGFAYLIYGRTIFVLTDWPSQFFTSGLTIAVAYATFSEGKRKEGIGVLVIYFIVSSGSILPHQLWTYVLSAIYIGGMAFGVSLYLRFTRRKPFDNPLMRIVAAAAVVAILNGAIILVLALTSPRWYFSHLGALLSAVHLNLKVGTMMGLMFGVGAEVSTTIENKIFVSKEVAE